MVEIQTEDLLRAAAVAFASAMEGVRVRDARRVWAMGRRGTGVVKRVVGGSPEFRQRVREKMLEYFPGMPEQEWQGFADCILGMSVLTWRAFFEAWADIVAEGAERRKT